MTLDHRTAPSMASMAAAAGAGAPAVAGRKRTFGDMTAGKPPGFSLYHAPPPQPPRPGLPYFAPYFHDAPDPMGGHVAHCRLVCGEAIRRAPGQGWHACRNHLAAKHSSFLTAEDLAKYSDKGKMKRARGDVAEGADEVVVVADAAPSIVAQLGARSSHDLRDAVTDRSSRPTCRSCSPARPLSATSSRRFAAHSASQRTRCDSPAASWWQRRWMPAVRLR